MNRTLLTASFAALLAAGSPLIVRASSTPPNAVQMAPLQYLLGAWHCNWKSGTQSGAEDQIFETALNGAWLQEQEVVDVDGRRVVASIHYTGYDPKTKTFVHVGPDANGTYELAQSPDGDVWSNADGTFVHHKVSDTLRTLQETDRANGTTISVSMTCIKTP